MLVDPVSVIKKKTEMGREKIDKIIYYEHLRCRNNSNSFFFFFGLNISNEHVSFTRIEDQRLIHLVWLCLDKS